MKKTAPSIERKDIEQIVLFSDKDLLHRLISECLLGIEN